MRTSKGQDIMIDDFVTMSFLHHGFYCMPESACYRKNILPQKRNYILYRYFTSAHYICLLIISMDLSRGFQTV